MQMYRKKERIICNVGASVRWFIQIRMSMVSCYDWWLVLLGHLQGRRNAKTRNVREEWFQKQKNSPSYVKQDSLSFTRSFQISCRRR